MQQYSKSFFKEILVMKHILCTVCTLAALVLFAAPCLAIDVEGTYNYMESGYKGTMTISRMGPRLQVHIPHRKHQQRPDVRLRDL